MTHKNINWSKLDEMIEKSSNVVKDHTRIKEIDEEIKKIEKEIDKLIEEQNELKKPYKQEYSKQLNDKLDDYGILKVIKNIDDQYEGHILSITKDIIKLRYTYNYGSYTDTIEIPTKELQEKGYCKYTYNNGYVIYIIDNVKEPLEVFEIIKHYLKVDINNLKRTLKWDDEYIEKYTKEKEETLNELENYKKVSDGMITRQFNKINFGLTDLKIEDILKSLPREICLYKEVE